jgi:hypothetical protein
VIEMGQKLNRTSADKEVVKAGDADPALLAPGKTRAQRFQEAQLGSQPTAKSEDNLITKSRGELKVREIKSILENAQIAFDSRAKKKDLLAVLEEHRLQKDVKQNLPESPELSPRGNTHASDYVHDPIITGNDEAQNHSSETQSTPHIIRGQEPWKGQSQMGLTRIESEPSNPRQQSSKRRATNESADIVPGHETTRIAKKRKTEHGKPDNKTHSLQGEHELASDVNRSLKRKATKENEDNITRAKTGHQTKRRKINYDDLDNAPSDGRLLWRSDGFCRRLHSVGHRTDGTEQPRRN